MAKKVVAKAAPKKAVAKVVAKKIEKKKIVAKPVVKVEAKKIEKKKIVAKPVAKVVEKKVVSKPVVIKEVAKLVVKPVEKKVEVKVENKAPEKTRYADSELIEFKEIIIRKLTSAKEELQLLTETLSNPNSNGTDDTAGTFKVLEDGSATLEKEHVNQLAARQRKFIDQLEAALIRIENKTYGVCRETGKLIPKERLRAVPHTTLSMEAKLKQN